MLFGSIPIASALTADYTVDLPAMQGHVTLVDGRKDKPTQYARNYIRSTDVKAWTWVDSAIGGNYTQKAERVICRQGGNTLVRYNDPFAWTGAARARAYGENWILIPWAITGTFSFEY